MQLNLQGACVLLSPLAFSEYLCFNVNLTIYFSNNFLVFIVRELMDFLLMSLSMSLKF